MRILWICLWIGAIHGIYNQTQLQGQSNALNVPTDRASLKVLFEELKQKPYEYEAILLQEQYWVGEEGMLTIRVRKGDYPVAGKSVKIVASQPLEISHYIRPIPSESENLSLQQPDSEWILAEPVAGSTDVFKTDWTGEIHVKFNVPKAGNHHFSVFFLNPTFNYNEHFINVDYQSIDAKWLQFYFVVPWLILLIGYAGTFLNLTTSPFFSWKERLIKLLSHHLFLSKYDSKKPVPILELNRPFFPIFPGLNFFSRTRLNKLGLSVYPYSAMIVWLAILGLGVLLMQFFGTSVLGAVSVWGIVLLAYGIGSKWRTSLFILILALWAQYYFYDLSGLASVTFSASEQALKVPYYGYWTAILLFNLGMPMPMGAIAFYAMDQFYYHSPYNEQLFWIACVASLGLLSLIVRRRVIMPA